MLEKLQVQFEVSVTLDDYRRASLLHTRLSRRSGYLIAAGFLGLAVLAAVLFQNGNGVGILLLTPLLAFLIARTMIRYVFLPEGALRGYSEQKMLHAPHQYTVSQDGLSGTSKYGQGIMPWDHFVKWKADARLLLLYHTGTQFIIIPKRAIGGQDKEAQLLDLLTRNGIPAA